MSSEIRNWLAQHDLVKHADVFESNEIDLDSVIDLTEDDLRELGIAMGPRKKLLRAITELSTDNSGTSSNTTTIANTDTAIPVAVAERRQVTVLFADICGYTRLSSELDAEETHALLEKYFRTVDDIIESFGGSVDKHIGDSVMAVFGAPVAHGDDPERAIRAAIAIHQSMPEVSEEVGRTVEVHIGVASGQVVASGIGNDNHYTVTGDSVNLASRLTDQAGPGESYLSAMVEQAVGTKCKTENIGELTLKGISDPVQVFRLVGFDKDFSQQTSRPFVGRQSELKQFQAALKSCAENSLGQVIYLRGEAGIGKTRLTEEFERTAVDLGFKPYRSLVLDFGVGKGKDAIGSLVRNLLSISPTSNKAERKEAADRAVESGLIEDNQAVFLNDLLDLPQSQEAFSLYNAMSNAVRIEGKRETVTALVRQLSATDHMILILEDLHWADDLVLGQLATIANAICDLPVILIMTSRIEGDQLNETWQATIAATPMMTINLRPLQKEDALALAADFFNTADKFAKSCVERADGNPLFLEQLLRGAEAATEGNVPGSIQSIVQARMDVLEAADKQALQAASVLGQRFSLDVLQNVIGIKDYSLTNLIERYLVRPEGDGFLFAHALVQDSVYNSLLTPNRNKLHAAAADWYRERDPILHAKHLDRAADPDAGIAYLNAAQIQADALRFDAAVTLASRGKELSQDDETLCSLCCVLADALLNTDETEDAISGYEEAVSHATNDQHRCMAWTGLAAALRVADRQEQALEALNNAEQAARNENLIEEQAHIHYLRGNLFFPLGRIDDCLKEHEASLELARQVSSAEAEAYALGGLGDAFYVRGHMKTAFENFKACVSVSQQRGFGRIEVANRHMLGWSRLHLMEFNEAAEDGKAAAEMAIEVSHRRAEVLGNFVAGFAESRLGNINSSAEHLDRALVLAQRIGAANFEANICRELAGLLASQGQIEEARNYADSALDIVRKMGMTFIGPAVLATWAKLQEDNKARLKALSEAETALDSGCVAHNQNWFAETAIDDALTRGEWDIAKKYALRLEKFTREQPLAWSDFMISRARNLSAWGRGERSKKLTGEIKALTKSAKDAGLKSALPLFEQFR